MEKLSEKENTKTAVQVDHTYYAQPKYATVERFISYQHQIATIRDAGVKRVLLVGSGDGLVPFYLQDVLGIDVTVCDIDPDLKPDIVGDVRKLPCEDSSFEAVVVFEVLEHLPFEDFPKALREISRVSQGKVFISLPYRNVAFEMMIKFPYIRTLLKRPWIHLIIKKPIKFLGFEYSGQHYWEIDTVTTKKKVEAVVSEVFNIEKRGHVVFDPYRYFLDLSKKEEMVNEYAKEHYNSFLKKLTTDYKSARWFATPAARLDFDQTRSVLKKFLPKNKVDSVLEIGPGDGVWTDLIIPHAHKLTLLDQSEEMIARAKKRLKDEKNITFINSDFLDFDETKKFQLIYAVRCFEYFEDKEAAMAKLAKLLAPGGKLVIVTKNPEHIRMKEVQKQALHRGQISNQAMEKLIKAHGLRAVSSLSATWRFKAKYVIFRFIFRVLHFMHVKTNGLFRVPFATNSLTESYIYVAKKG